MEIVLDRNIRKMGSKYALTHSTTHVLSVKLKNEYRGGNLEITYFLSAATFGSQYSSKSLYKRNSKKDSGWKS